MVCFLLSVFVLLFLIALFLPLITYDQGFREGIDEGVTWGKLRRDFMFGSNGEFIFIMTVLIGIAFFFGLVSGLVGEGIDQQIRVTEKREKPVITERFTPWQDVGDGIWLTRDTATGACYLMRSGGTMLTPTQCN